MKKTIKTKLILSYLFIMLISIAIMSIFINVTIKKYYENKSIIELRKEATIVTEMFRKNVTENDIDYSNSLKSLINTKIKFKRYNFDSNIDLLVQIKKANYKIIPLNNKESTITPNDISKITEQFRKNKTNKFYISFDNINYIATAIPLFTKGLPNKSKQKNWLLIYISTLQIDTFTNEIGKFVTISIIIIGIIAIFVGILMANKISTPIYSLKQMATNMADKNYSKVTTLKTGDEIEDLSIALKCTAEKLKAYDDYQKQFIQNVSHELKTPLMSIQGYAEGIKDGVFDNQMTPLNIIIEESQRLKNIVDEIIFLTKLESVDEFYNYEKIDLYAVIEKSIEKSNGLCFNKKIKIIQQTHENINFIGDNEKLIQAIINILSNCIKYAKKEILVSYSKDNNIIKIIIIDDGNGLDEQDIQNIFKRFYKGKTGGTGLGMHITKVIVEKHYGTIHVENDNKLGAKFIITLDSNKFNKKKK